MKVGSEVGRNEVGLWEVSARSGLVGDGELISLAGPFIEAGRWRNKVGYIDRLPDSFASLGIVPFAGELDGREPDAELTSAQNGNV